MEKSIQSHTLQRRQSLKEISENGHVITFGTKGRFDLNSPKLVFKSIGVTKSSIFPGFCNKHDRQIFIDIENFSSFYTKRQASLIGYRVVCMELFKKEHNVRIFTDPILVAASKKRGTYDKFEAFLEGTNLGIADLRRNKRRFEKALHYRDYNDFSAVYVPMLEPLPFCFATTFAPEFTLDGRAILPELDEAWDTAFAFAGRLAGEDFLLICGFDSEAHDVRSFVGSAGYIPEDYGGSAALYLAVEYSENTFFRPSWVDGLTPEVKDGLLSQFISGIPGDADTRKASLLSWPNIVNIARGEPFLMEN